MDNDEDGDTDFPADLGCVSPDDNSEDSASSPACSDGRDNDGDGLVDYPIDPGCGVPQIDSEVDDCPDGPNCAQCADGRDNDNNGAMDYPDDPGCIAAGDPIEFTDNTVACGAGLMVSQLPSTGMITSMVSAASVSNIASPCGGGGGAQGIAYVLHVTTPSVIVASTADSLTTFDTVLDLRAANCSDASAEIACHDDLSGVNKASTITQAIDPGTYYLIVQGKTASATGTFVLTVEMFPGQGQPCDTQDDCGPGLLCRTPAGQTDLICTGPVCDDGVDDDGDGKADYPADPGCATPTDETETDICSTMPADPGCPACGNGRDDDGDLAIDYPDDPSCVSASGISESCASSEPTIVATGPQTTGTTAGAANDYTPIAGSVNGHACSTTGLHTAPDVVVQLDLPATQSLQLRLNPVGFDSSHTLLGAACTGAPIDCSDLAIMNPINGLAAGRYYVVIDGYSSGSGTFTLNVGGTIANGESCESPFFGPTGLTCTPGYSCKGNAGSRVCAPAECNDGADNNSNGKMDYPADPGCDSTSDDDETTVCPGASCPACSDGADNDGDQQTDYPMDTNCVAASSTTEDCTETDALVAITAPQTNGTLVGTTDDHDPSCTTLGGPDKIYSLNITTPLQSLVIDTEGSAVDTVLSLMDSSCGEPSIACDDEGGLGTGDSLITRTNVLPGSYKIAVDGKSAVTDTFLLNVRGTLYPGASCESPLVTAGVVVCPPMFGCNGTPGSRTCTAAQCLDGVDNNSNGKIDFPNDPGCTSANDNTETTVCPGASCPACGDGLDNDSDGRTDYPADSACISASYTSESCFDSDPIQAVTLPLHSGTLTGATDDRFPMCATSTGADVVWTLDVPNLQSLTIDTEASVVDTVLTFGDGDCSSVVACDDDGALGAGDSLITRSFVPAGKYAIGVDTKSIVPNTYNLAVHGVVAPGGSCEHPLFASGVLSCSTGFACGGNAGSRTCRVAQCSDGIDNNSNGKTDFPFDAGCLSASDNTETTVCPGASCPVCADGVDNDGDGATDFPDDATCSSASFETEACRTSEPVRAITALLTTGNTLPLANDFAPTCGSTSNTAPDEVLQLDLPAMDSLSLNVLGFDTAHSLLSSTCENPPLACSDPSLLTRTNVTAGRYYVVIDGWGSGSGEWEMATTGVIALGGSCESPLYTAGAFVCAAGSTCTGTPGSRTCTTGMPACSDGTDNDSDGKMDYPADPGCMSASDTDEADACPGGAGCPQCGNGVDDDTDGFMDYPNDTRCASASFFLESFCPIEANVAGMVTTPATSGTLVGAADNFEQSCQTNTGNDVTYGLALPVPVAELVIHTVSSAAANTVLSLWSADCITELACDDDGAPTTSDNRSLITKTNVPAGTYAIQVDSFSTTNNQAFLLSVRGTVAPGTACTSPLFGTGVLVCPSGTTCSSGSCQ